MRKLVKLMRAALAAQRSGRLAAPMKVTACVTARCNSRCRTCRIWEKRPADEMTTGEWDRVFRGLRGTSWLDLTGGEPFLRPDLAEIIASSLEHCRDLYLLHLVTNGLVPTAPAVVESALAKRPPPLTLVSVSLDGPPELNDRLRGVAGGWARAVETFAALRERRSTRFRVFLGMTLSAENVGAFSEALASVRRVIPDVRAEEFHLNIAQAAAYYGNEGGEGITADPGAIARALDEYHGLLGARLLSPVSLLEASYQRLGRRYARSGRCPLACRSLDVSCRIDAQGRVHPCLMWDRPAGDLRDAGMDCAGIWQGRKAEETRAAIRAGSCPHCWTPCEAYQTIVANLTRPWRLV